MNSPFLGVNFTKLDINSLNGGMRRGDMGPTRRCATVSFGGVKEEAIAKILQREVLRF
ncbi:MAG: hypothetical protein LBF25_01880 [Puniceicoccales bacterium]|jgi:hypothetical protein|nr:hypothetical protein [Puniceicoccales bacterium]